MNTLRRRYGRAHVRDRIVQVPQRDRNGKIVFWRPSPIGASADTGELHRIARSLYGNDYRIIETADGDKHLRVRPLPHKKLSNGTTN